MSKILELPFYTIAARDLAEWLEQQPDKWWSVDGDPMLTSRVDFPCPTEELATELRRIERPLRIYDPSPGSAANGQAISIDRLDSLADTNNNSLARTYLLSWETSPVQWLLAEDTSE